MATSEMFQSANNSKPLKKQVILEIGGKIEIINTFSETNIIAAKIFGQDCLKIKKKSERSFLCCFTRNVFVLNSLVKDQNVLKILRNDKLECSKWVLGESMTTFSIIPNKPLLL